MQQLELLRSGCYYHIYNRGINSCDLFVDTNCYQNPVHHGFEDSVKDYPWSSYQTCISVKPTNLKREKVLDWFGFNFDIRHSEVVEARGLGKWLEIDI